MYTAYVDGKHKRAYLSTSSYNICTKGLITILPTQTIHKRNEVCAYYRCPLDAQKALMVKVFTDSKRNLWNSFRVSITLRKNESTNKFIAIFENQQMGMPKFFGMISTIPNNKILYVSIDDNDNVGVP